jgi:hypothetical protein
LSQEAIKGINSTIDAIEKGERVTEDQMRSAIRMMDYAVETIDGNSTIVARHVGLKDNLTIDPSTKIGKDIIASMRRGSDIMSGKINTSNLTRFKKSSLPDDARSWTEHGGAA